jgi:hypothetical protein
MDRAHQRGFALPVAIFALVIAMTVIAGSAYIARQETRIGSAVRMGAEAFYLAETGINDLMVDWPTVAISEMAMWEDTTIEQSLGSGDTRTKVTRIGEWLYLMESVSEVTEGGVLAGASREAAMVVRLFSPEIRPPAALTTRGLINVRGNAEVHGEDQMPEGWDGYCPNGPQNQPGILIDNATNVTTEGAGQITGTPPVVEDMGLNDSTFLEFGGLSYSDLVILADKAGPTGIINTTGPELTADDKCNTSISTNWGDPLNQTAPCGSYFPMVHVPGNLRIQSGGVGQGVLLVDGNLELRGDFTYYGVVIVQGNFETQGNGNKVYGGVLASNATIDAQVLTGGSAIVSSSCATERAVFNSAVLTRPRPLTRRSWVDMSAVRND